MAGVPSLWNTTCTPCAASGAGLADATTCCVQNRPAPPGPQATSPPAAPDVTRATASGKAWPPATRSITRTLSPSPLPLDSAMATRRPSGDGRMKSMASEPSGDCSFGSNNTRSLPSSSTDFSDTSTGRCNPGDALSANSTPPRSTSAVYALVVDPSRPCRRWRSAVRAGIASRYRRPYACSDAIQLRVTGSAAFSSHVKSSLTTVPK